MKQSARRFSAKSRQVVEYALSHKGKPMTLRHVGEEFGISRQRVHQILAQAGIRNIFARSETPRPLRTLEGRSKEWPEDWGAWPRAPKASGARAGTSKSRRPGYLPTVLPEIAALKKQGASLHALSRVFDYDRTTLRKALRAYLAGDKNIWPKKRKEKGTG